MCLPQTQKEAQAEFPVEATSDFGYLTCGESLENPVLFFAHTAIGLLVPFLPSLALASAAYLGLTEEKEDVDCSYNVGP